MRQQDRRIVLFLDGFSGHKSKLVLSHIELAFLPPNTTSLTQPMDQVNLSKLYQICRIFFFQGVIRSLKCAYRKLILLRLLDNFNKQEKMEVPLITALRMLRTAWGRVSAKTIIHCFHLAGITMTDLDPVNEGE